MVNIIILLSMFHTITGLVVPVKFKSINNQLSFKTALVSHANLSNDFRHPFVKVKLRNGKLYDLLLDTGSSATFMIQVGIRSYKVSFLFKQYFI